MHFVHFANRGVEEDGGGGEELQHRGWRLGGRGGGDQLDQGGKRVGSGIAGGFVVRRGEPLDAAERVAARGCRGLLLLGERGGRFLDDIRVLVVEQPAQVFGQRRARRPGSRATYASVAIVEGLARLGKELGAILR